MLPNDSSIERLDAVGIRDILAVLPHRYPFVLVDKIIGIKNDERGIGIKNVTMNEPFFNGHFPHRPVMPGVLMLEAMAQAAALLSFRSLDIVPDDNTVYDFAAIDGAPVALLFVLLVPEAATDEHLELLRQIASMLDREDVRARLRQAQTSESLYQVVVDVQSGA